MSIDVVLVFFCATGYRSYNQACDKLKILNPVENNVFTYTIPMFQSYIKEALANKKTAPSKPSKFLYQDSICDYPLCQQ